MSPETTSPDLDEPVVLLNAKVWRKRMTKLGFPTITEQAEQVKCARSALYDVINGRAEPRRRLVRRMVAVSGLPPKRLLKVADR